MFSSASVEKLRSIRSAMLSNLVDSVLISLSSVSIWLMIFPLLLCSVSVFECCCVVFGSSMFLCFRCIFCSVVSVRSRLFICLCVPGMWVRGGDMGERERGNGRE